MNNDFSGIKLGVFELKKGKKVLATDHIFTNDDVLMDYHSNTLVTVENNTVLLNNNNSIVLLGKAVTN